MTASSPSRSAVSQMRLPGSLYLTALLSRLHNTWASRVLSASTYTGSVGQRHRQFVALLLDQRPAHFHARCPPPPPG